MPDTSIAYTRDESWRIDLVAFQINAFVYRAIGATIRGLPLGDKWHSAVALGEMGGTASRITVA